MIARELEHYRLPTCIALAFWIMSSVSALSQILIPVQDQSLVDAEVLVDVQFDVSTDLYTYSYTVINGPTAQQEIWSFAVEVDADIVGVQSPQGWSAGLFADQPILSWDATDLTGVDLPPPEEDDGNVLPSPFDIPPGGMQGGFSFRSPEAPASVIFYAQGFAELPAAVSDGDFDGIAIPLFTENSMIGFTLGPGLSDDIIFAGGQRPSVDGFLGFVGLVNRATLPAPISILIRFGVNGEQVNVSSFRAELNSTDVTAQFKPTGNGDEMVAFFELGDGSLIIGRNVLVTSVEGTVPDTTRVATDTDRLTIFVQ